MYVARYAHQPFPVIRALTIADLSDVIDAIGGIVEEENPKDKR